MRRRMLWLLGVLGVLVVAGVVVPVAPAHAKSFRIVAVQIEAELRPDGSMRVVEHLTYEFQGRFRRGLRPIPPGDYELVDVSVSEAGRSLAFEGAPHDLVWFHDGEDEQRTFDIAYTVLGAAKVGPDVGELYWKWVGEDHPGVSFVRVALEVPGDGTGVRAFAHGPLHGVVEPRGSTVLFSVDRLPSGQFVEGRVAVPATAFTVAPSGPPRLPEILGEEQRLAAEANAQREAERAREERVEDLVRAMAVLAPLAVVGGWAVFLAAWLRWGREHRLATDVGEYLRELPDDPPPFVDPLRRWGKVRPLALAATIVDLAQRGFLTIEEVRQPKPDWVLRWKQPPGNVLPHEYAVLEQLFRYGPEVHYSGFLAWVRNNRTEALRFWERFRDQIAAGVRQQSWVEGGKGPAYGLNVVVALAVGLVGFLSFAVTPLLGLVVMASAVVQMACTGLLRRRTRAGAQRLAEWQAVERFLRDFSQLEEAPVGHLVLWERYLVAAVALGLSSDVIRALAVRMPAPAATAGGPDLAPAAWFITRDPSGFADLGRINDFASSFGPQLVAAAQPPSSSSSRSGFGGGGFSGGGGGGGGGGGIGAD